LCDLVAYLALLENKPNSFDFGKPLEDWELPEAFAILRRRLESDGSDDGRREFIRILRLLEKPDIKNIDVGRRAIA